ncbi:MAG: DUF1049 domain-containing protein [Deltaproteobacteria bacterium]|nr:DUF1049 domain-containing protein [Deltaproteobacteria bacterium]
MRFLSRLANFWLLITFVSFTAYFAVYNHDRVSLHLPPWIEQITMPGYMVHLGFFFGGAAVVSVYFGIDSLRKALIIRRLRRQLRDHGIEGIEDMAPRLERGRASMESGEPTL